MIEYLLVQHVRISCDRCGQSARPGPPFWSSNIVAARQEALASGLTLDEWDCEGCARELWLCSACKGQSGGKGVVRVP